MGTAFWLPGFLLNPDVAYILLVVGIFGVIFELSAPGTIAPGVAGGVALILSFLVFSRLPTNVGGVIFIAIAIVLFIVDIKAPTHGVLTAAGIVAFVLGSVLLFPVWRSAAAASQGIEPISPIRVSPVTIVVMTLLVTGFFVFVLGKGIRAQALRISFGAEALLGAAGHALTELDPDGLVQSGGEQWSARCAEGTVAAGENVEIIGREGLRLLVRRAPQGARRIPEGG
jgi:membrane-bound serine protease (ClpP class)